MRFFFAILVTLVAFGLAVPIPVPETQDSIRLYKRVGGPNDNGKKPNPASNAWTRFKAAFNGNPYPIGAAPAPPPTSPPPTLGQQVLNSGAAAQAARAGGSSRLPVIKMSAVVSNAAIAARGKRDDPTARFSTVANAGGPPSPVQGDRVLRVTNPDNRSSSGSSGSSNRPPTPPSPSTKPPTGGNSAPLFLSDHHSISSFFFTAWCLFFALVLLLHIFPKRYTSKMRFFTSSFLILFTLFALGLAVPVPSQETYDSHALYKRVGGDDKGKKSNGLSKGWTVIKSQFTGKPAPYGPSPPSTPVNPPTMGQQVLNAGTSAQGARAGAGERNPVIRMPMVVANAAAMARGRREDPTRRLSTTANAGSGPPSPVQGPPLRLVTERRGSTSSSGSSNAPPARPPTPTRRATSPR
ncbi:hypothetical protein M408DRAFT_23133 [Serendipita vermifera MAFF 305830]|uniref:Uncharacterized protein n=1 Tax=Serendipita vermifera MAFF 305830 TaxID=933852 RepID=A0A0C3BB68_SERVB|nr:hypothetical protein M408DRAFT_23133 [Serendipita vermifera MAFF 305830]